MPAVVGDVFGTVVASRAGETEGLARQRAVGASRAGLLKAGSLVAEEALGTGASML